MDRKRRGVLIAILCASPAAAQTRPFLTEEATTAPAGTVALESGFDWISHQPNFLTGAERIRWDGPILRLVYSPADRVEMDLEWVAAIGVTSDPDFGTRSALGDVTMRAKVRFAEDSEQHTAFGARFAVTLPETGFGDGLAPNTIRTRAELLLSKRGRRTRVHVNAGVAIEDAPLEPHEQADFFAWGAAMDYEFLSGVALTAEGNGLVGNPLPGAGGRGEARMGL
ncbi:MAG TPA: hypothetical protein VKA01_08690, partial [Vicinamibacteria bacterium]|nr:hypothetical protein [Vicinamibacteria bacterium]